MVDAPRRLHPISPLFELIGAVRQLAAPALAVLVSGQWWFALPVLVIAFGRAVSWFRFTYQVDGDVVRINEGLFVRKKRTIALDRIQQIDVVSKLRHRLMGVVGLHVDTASGASGAELRLEVVSTAEAERLRRIFETHETAVSEVSPPPLVSVSVGQLALAGMTGAQTLVILGIVYSLQEIGELVDFGRFRTLIPEGADSDPVAIAAGVVSLGLVWLALAAAAMVFTDYRYTMTVSGGEFRVTRGLLDRREVGGTLARVQAVHVTQSVMRRVLGFAAVRVQTAAVPGQEVSRIVIPYVADSDVPRVAHALLPDSPAWPALQRTPRAALALAAFRRVPAVAIVSVVVAAVLYPWGLLALSAIPLAVGAAWLHWSTHGFAMRDTTVWARRGGLYRHTVVVPAGKVQSLRQAESVLQRRYGLATLRLDVAGRGATPLIQDAPTPALDEVIAQAAHAAATDERAQLGWLAPKFDVWPSSCPLHEVTTASPSCVSIARR